MDSLSYPLIYLTFVIHPRLSRKLVMLPSTVLDRLIGVSKFYDRNRLDITTNATMRMTMAPIAVDISNMSGNSGGSVLVVDVVGVVVPVSSVVVEGVEVVESFHPESMAISHQNARPFCSQLV